MIHLWPQAVHSSNSDDSFMCYLMMITSGLRLYYFLAMSLMLPLPVVYNEQI